MEKTEKFDNSTDTIYDWLSRFEMKARLKEIPEDKWEQWVRVTIGRVGESVLRNTEFTTWTALREHLETSLGTRDIAARSVMELHQLKQKSDENIRQLGARAACLARQAFPQTPRDIQEREATNAFIRAQPSNIQFELIKSDCKSISEICTLTEKLQEAHKQTTRTVGAAAGNPHEEQIRKLQAQIQQMTLQLENKTDTQRQNQCDYCKNWGHQITDCRKRQRLVRTGSFRRPGNNSQTIECFRCGGRGHIQRNCPTPNPGNAIRAIPSDLE